MLLGKTSPQREREDAASARTKRRPVAALGSGRVAKRLNVWIEIQDGFMAHSQQVLKNEGLYSRVQLLKQNFPR
jgi:hypothetical protein